MSWPPDKGATARLDKEGPKVALVEHGKFGGTCINDGCTRTKALIASAYAAHMARRAGGAVMQDGEPGTSWAHDAEPTVAAAPLRRVSPACASRGAAGEVTPMVG